MSKVLHLPDGDKQIPTSEEETAAQEMAAQQEAQMRKWVEQADPIEMSVIQWDLIESDEMAQAVMSSLGDFTQAFTMARVMHHSAVKGTPPKTVGITLQVRTFTDDDQVIEDVEVDLSSLVKPQESSNGS